MKNQKLIQYFLGNPIRNVWYTILGFQKNVSNFKDKASLKNISQNTNHLSYFIAYNHHRCRIEYYLINYGYPHSLKASDLPLEMLHKLNNNNLDDLSINRFHIDFSGTEQWGENSQLDNAAREFNKLPKDGKLTLNFFKVFLTHLVIQNKARIRLSGLYDLRLITGMMYHEGLKNWIVDESRLPQLYNTPMVSSLFKGNLALRFHIQERFKPDSYVTQLTNITGSNVNFISIPKAEEAPCIHELRSTFQSKAFESNADLNNKINIFNGKMFQKYQELLHSK